MKDLIDITSSPVRDYLGILLEDKTTKKTIIWATDSYQSLGNDFLDHMHMDPVRVLEAAQVMKPRSQKTIEDQLARTRKRAEVFTPAFIVNQMNNHADSIWFGRNDVFNIETEDGWEPTTDPIQFPSNKNWKKYVDSRRMEIACGEGPYLVSRYDASTGEAIPLHDRIGLLDRKLRIVTENAEDDEWLKWALRAVESIYGYEYQGDNLLMARANVFLTFVDYHREARHTMPSSALLRRVAHIIAWNLWQMDGLNDRVPLGKHFDPEEQLSFFAQAAEDPEDGLIAYPCKIKDWRSKTTTRMDALKEREMGKKLFDYVIGNPPYQEETVKEGDRKSPVYYRLMDECFKLSDAVILITPARFLFDAGQTPSSWNKKMLNDSHFKVLHYEADASKIFNITEIKGGVAITYRNNSVTFEPIKLFTKYPELNHIISRIDVVEKDNPRMDSIIASQGLYKFSKKIFTDHPQIREAMGKGTGKKIVSSVMNKLPSIFKNDRFENSIKMLGRIDGERAYRYISCDYVEDNDYLEKYNLFLPEANGSGQFGEVLTLPIIGYPGEGSADTYLSAGQFSSKLEPRNLTKYAKTKFFRALLGARKVTQHSPSKVWEPIPLQDFTASSDIDWSASVAAIDCQLYRKYNLSSEEIDFIETYVKEMV